MGQFKPMVKMMTTEPSVELKLKKGGAVTMKKGGSAKKKADGGAMGALATTPALVGRPAVNAPVRSPMRPPMTARRKAMSISPMMRKHGGEAEESEAEHKAEAKATANVAKKLKEHAGKPASKAHKGLATGGVVMGQGGYKNGGIITEKEGSRDAGAYKNTKMVTTSPDHSPAKTGGVKLGNAGGYKTGGVAKSNAGGYKKGGMPMKGGKPAFLAKKKGGAAKKYAEGGSVNDSGKPVEMPQGQKKPSTPVSINQLSGTFKKGGQVMTPAEKRLTKTFDKENAPAMKAAKADSNEVYSKYGKMKMRYGGMC